MGLFDKFKKQPGMSVGDAAKVLSVRIFESAAINAESVKKFCNDENDEKSNIDPWQFWQIIFEFQFLFVHITDRLSFELLAQDKRAILMDILADITLDSTIESAFKSVNLLGLNEKKKLKTSMMNDYNARQLEYGNYEKMVAKKDESAKNTLLWEFGKKIAECVGHPMDIKYVLSSMVLAVESLKALEVRDILQSIH